MLTDHSLTKRYPDQANAFPRLTHIANFGVEDERQAPADRLPVAIGFFSESDQSQIELQLPIVGTKGGDKEFEIPCRFGRGMRNAPQIFLRSRASRSHILFAGHEDQIILQDQDTDADFFRR